MKGGSSRSAAASADIVSVVADASLGDAGGLVYVRSRDTPRGRTKARLPSQI